MPSVKLLAPLLLCITAALGSVRDRDVFIEPSTYGGNSLAYFPGMKVGEPLNIIISGQSSAHVVSSAGFKNWYTSISFAAECGGIHMGDAMHTIIDGRGQINETAVIRELSPGENPKNGACDETFGGGNHFRYWQQKGSKAWFLAVSIEEDILHNHTITKNGYDLGRDDIVKRATRGSSYGNFSYTATVEKVKGYLPRGSKGINHDIPLDGFTAVLTITSTEKA